MFAPYRWCAGSNCKNTTLKTPEKLFIKVPNDIKMRNTWLELSGRDPKKLSTKSVLHLCEDHFELENDMENYMRFKIMGSVKKVIMKPNTVPSKFNPRPNITSRQPKEHTLTGKVDTSSTSYESAPGLGSKMPPVQVKEEPDWEATDASGVSEAAVLQGLYADHLVKDELVLGPEVLQPPDVVYGIQALAAAKDTPAQAVRPSSVRLERMLVDTERGVCKIGHRIYKLGSGHMGDCDDRNVHLEEHKLSDIIKQFENAPNSATDNQRAPVRQNCHQDHQSTPQSPKPLTQPTIKKPPQKLPALFPCKVYSYKPRRDSHQLSHTIDSYKGNQKQKTALTKLLCKHCNKYFPTVASYMIHMNMNTLDMNNDTKEQKYFCKMCSKYFSSLNDLCVHAQEHSVSHASDRALAKDTHIQTVNSPTTHCNKNMTQDIDLGEEDTHDLNTHSVDNLLLGVKKSFSQVQKPKLTGTVGRTDNFNDNMLQDIEVVYVKRELESGFDVGIEQWPETFSSPANSFPKPSNLVTPASHSNEDMRPEIEMVLVKEELEESAFDAHEADSLRE